MKKKKLEFYKKALFIISLLVISSTFDDPSRLYWHENSPGKENVRLFISTKPFFSTNDDIEVEIYILNNSDSNIYLYGRFLAQSDVHVTITDSDGNIVKPDLHLQYPVFPLFLIDFININSKEFYAIAFNVSFFYESLPVGKYSLQVVYSPPNGFEKQINKTLGLELISKKVFVGEARSNIVQFEIIK